MEKEPYEEVDVQIIVFEGEDVIATSGEGEGGDVPVQGQ